MISIKDKFIVANIHPNLKENFDKFCMKEHYIRSKIIEELIEQWLIYKGVITEDWEMQFDRMSNIKK